MFDVITFGSATLDIFLEPGRGEVREEKRFKTGRGLCFPFSSKVDVRDMDYETGGGGTNTAASLSRFGLKTVYRGSIGRDFAGSEVLKDLRRFGVEEGLVEEKERLATNLSVIFSLEGERTVFVWREASEAIAEETLSRERLEAEWFYLAPLSGRARRTFGPLTNLAQEKGIKVLANPGNSQIGIGVENLKPILDRIDILLLNREEASLLTGIPYDKEKEVFQRLDRLVKGLAIMTKGEQGAVASDGKHLWKAEALPAEVVEKTGAGDSFGAGFLSGFMEKGEVGYGLQKGIANSAACIGRRGAKEGLLGEGEDFERTKIEKVSLGRQG